MKKLNPIIAMDSLSIGYAGESSGPVVIASNINLSLLEGELVCLLGPNGAGKSTLLRTISGMQKPIAGKVMLENEDMHLLPSKKLAQKLSVVLTEKVEGGLLTAYEIVGLGRYPYTNWSGKLTQKDHDVISQAISLVGAEELALRPIIELSDGERQKIMMARALAQEPKVMILDEITAFLDLPRRVEFMGLLQRFAHENNRAVLLSTHDLDLALRCADKIWLLPKGGSLAEGAPEDLVINSKFQEAFASEGIEFEANTGSFRIHTPLKPSVVITGDPFLVSWTEKSLGRIGLCNTKDSDAPIQITINSDKNKPVWKVTKNNRRTEFVKIYDMISSLKE